MAPADVSLELIRNEVQCQSRDLACNPMAPAGGGMPYNSREVALSSVSRDNSTCELQCTLFLKLGSHYYRAPPAPAEGGSTQS